MSCSHNISSLKEESVYVEKIKVYKLISMYTYIDITISIDDYKVFGKSAINDYWANCKIDGDLSNASYTVIDKNNGFFYWSQGNKVYVSYNPSNGDTGTCEEVTLQDTEGNPVTITDDICMLTQCNNNLCIATWSDTNKGKAYIVSTNQSDSRLLTVQNIFETNNPVKSVTTW